jgi:hypothetical protein
MPTKDRKLTKKDFTKKGLINLINRDLEEINHLSNEDLLSLWSFFKYLLAPCPDDDKKLFLTKKNSIIWQHKETLEKNHYIKIIEEEEFIKAAI